MGAEGRSAATFYVNATALKHKSKSKNLTYKGATEPVGAKGRSAATIYVNATALKQKSNSHLGDTYKGTHQGVFYNSLRK